MTTSRRPLGEWSPLLDLKCVAVHATLLPNGKILYWGRRANPKDTRPESLNEHFTTCFVLDLNTGISQKTSNQPMRVSESGVFETVNLFCSGHALQPDGCLFVAGGHLFDSKGVNQACVYDPAADKWTPRPLMNHGRWYPSVLALPDGGMLVMSGSYAQFNAGTRKEDIVNNTAPQIWKNDSWQSVPDVPSSIVTLFPRIHLDPQGRVFVGGTNAESRSLEFSAMGAVSKWSGPGPLRGRNRDQACSVRYDRGKIMYVGGDDPPTNIVEFIDLNQANPKWTSDPATNMAFPRRQHNATILPDGSVLVTGGSMGNGFNNLDRGQTVREPELWSPKTKTWKKMAPEAVDRCYHGTALLLPDGRIMSGGNGEYETDGGVHSHAHAQFFSPSYLFIPGARPAITTFPATIDYKQQFEVVLKDADMIQRVSWVRLGSVTHCTNMNQSLIFLQFTPTNSQTSKITITAPENPKEAQPGHYMLFLLNAGGQPSIAPIIQLKSAPIRLARAAFAVHEPVVNVSLPALDKRIIEEQTRGEQVRAPVVVGLTSICPYGLAACWGGAFDALQRMSNVDVVRPVPSASDSVAFVYLKQDTLPDIDEWREELAQIVSRQYELRGIEMTLEGAVKLDGQKTLTLMGTATRPKVELAEFRQENKIQYDTQAKAIKRINGEEAGAYGRLVEEAKKREGELKVQVTGTLVKHGDKSVSLAVREFVVIDTAAS